VTINEGSMVLTLLKSKDGCDSVINDVVQIASGLIYRLVEQGRQHALVVRRVRFNCHWRISVIDLCTDMYILIIRRAPLKYSSSTLGGRRGLCESSSAFGHSVGSWRRSATITTMNQHIRMLSVDLNQLCFWLEW
jgi:hypothetical protein